MSAIVSTVEEVQAGLVRYHCALPGTVVAVDDPLKLHRVKAQIPGLIEPSTDWLLPAGGGSPQKGGHIAPSVGAQVIVWFVGGDPQGIGLYLPAWWGTPSAGPETPTAMHGLSPADAAKVHALEVGGFSVVIDERNGARQLVIEDKVLGSLIQVNGVLGEVRVSGSVTVRIEAPRISIEGAEVTINGRQVLPSAKPI